MMLMAVRLLADLPPNPGPVSAGLPAIASLSTVFGWLTYIALGLCAAAGIMSGAALAIGNATARVDMALRGKAGLLWSLGGAVVIGIAVPLVDAFYSLVAR